MLVGLPPKTLEVSLDRLGDLVEHPLARPWTQTKLRASPYAEISLGARDASLMTDSGLRDRQSSLRGLVSIQEMKDLPTRRRKLERMDCDLHVGPSVVTPSPNPFQVVVSVFALERRVKFPAKNASETASLVLSLKENGEAAVAEVSMDYGSNAPTITGAVRLPYHTGEFPEGDRFTFEHVTPSAAGGTNAFLRLLCGFRWGRE
jgi:hypothetical protein